MNKVAIIDLGTNTFNLLIVSINGNGSYQHIFQTKTAVKLGEGGINKNIIIESAFERGINALIGFNELIKTHQVDKIFAFATSAIRSATNGALFVKEVKSKVGIDVQVIDGIKEAELIYLGVKSALQIGTAPTLIMDIGGGSTEFIIANDNQLFWRQSFNIGVARLIEKFHPSDPIKAEEILSLEKYLTQELSPLLEVAKTFQLDSLIGSSGSFDTLAEMISFRFNHPQITNNFTSYHYNLDEVKIINEEIIRTNKEERKNIKGLIEMRADMIVVATICVNLMLKLFNIKQMRLSTFSLKEGVLSELMNSTKNN